MRSRSLCAAVAVVVVGSVLSGCGSAAEAGPEPGPMPEVKSTPDDSRGGPVEVAPWTPEAVAAEPPEEQLTPASPVPSPPPPAPAPAPVPEVEPEPDPAGSPDSGHQRDRDHEHGRGQGEEDGQDHFCFYARDLLNADTQAWCEQMFN